GRGGPDGVAVEAAPKQEIRGLAAQCQVVDHARTVPPPHEVTGHGPPVVVAGLGKGLERSPDGVIAQAVGRQLRADAQRAMARLRTHARKADGEAAVVLPAGLGHALDRGLGLAPVHTAHLELARELLAGMLAPHEQAHRALRRRQLRPPPARRVGALPLRLRGSLARARVMPGASGTRPRHAQALASFAALPPLVGASSASGASSALPFATTTGAIFARSSASIRCATSTFSLRYWRAFSLPWPMRSSP